MNDVLGFTLLFLVLGGIATYFCIAVRLGEVEILAVNTVGAPPERLRV